MSECKNAVQPDPLIEGSENKVDSIINILEGESYAAAKFILERALNCIQYRSFIGLKYSQNDVRK